MTAEDEVNALLRKLERKPGAIDLSLERISAFLQKIGSPHLKTPPVVHFAGTNGKGSTIAFLRAMIEAGGQSCHVYTSPHLVRFNERIVVAGEEIGDKALLDILQRLDAEYEKHGIELTFFELTTVAAFMAFAETKADYLLLETGLGGRFDATNVIPKPRLTVITPISIDHVEFLGNSLAGIANEKAGIIKPGVVCISAPQVPEVAEVLQKAGEVVFAESFALPEISLKGEHQKINATTAASAARELGLSEAAIAAGLANAKWPARMQRLVGGELVDLLPPGFELWLDGAHNIAGAEALADMVGKMDKPVYLVCGMLENKDAAGYFKALKGKAEAIYTISIAGAMKGFAPEELARIAGGKAAADAAAAIKEIVAEAKLPSSIFICGSLYLAGNILKDNG